MHTRDVVGVAHIVANMVQSSLVVEVLVLR